MTIICVDDERLAINNIMEVLAELNLKANSKGFTKPLEALDYIKTNTGSYMPQYGWAEFTTRFLDTQRLK